MVRGRSALCQVRQDLIAAHTNGRGCAWKKEQAKKYLRAAGKPDHPSWSADELKSYIMELKAAMVVMLNMTMKSSHEDIAEECWTKSIVLFVNVTKARMMRKLRAVANDQIVVPVGEHTGKTFGEVRTQYPGYVGWAMKATSKDPMADPRLRFFGRWLGEVEGADDGPDEDDVPMTRSPSRPTAGEMTTGSLDLDPPSRTGDAEDDLGAPSDAASASDAMLQVLERLRALEVRVDKVEGESWAVPPALEHGYGVSCGSPPAVAGANKINSSCSIRMFLNARHCSVGLDDKKDNRSSWHGLIVLASVRSTRVYPFIHSRLCVPVSKRWVEATTC